MRWDIWAQLTMPGSNCFLVPRKFFRESKKTNIEGNFGAFSTFFHKNVCVSIRIDEAILMSTLDIHTYFIEKRKDIPK